MCFKENIYKKCHFRLLLKKRIITLVSAINQILFMRKNFALATILSIIVGLSIFSLNNTNILDDVLNIKSTERTLKILLPPTVNFTFNNNNMCEGTTIAFESDVTDGVGNIDYDWDFGDSSNSTQTNPTHVFNAPNGCGTTTYSVKLLVTDENGDTDSISYNVTVFEKPNIDVIDIDNQFDPFSNCASASPNFLINVENESDSCISTFSVNWGDGNTESNITFPISHNYSQIGVYQMTFTGVGNNGCIGTKSYPVKNVSNPAGAVVSPGNTNNLCAPTEELGFSITSWGENSDDTTYQIDYGDGTIVSYSQTVLKASTYYDAANPSNSTNFPIPHIYPDSSCPGGGFDITLTITNACDTTTSQLLNITVLSDANPDFIWTGNECINNSILFQSTGDLGFGPNCNQNAIYDWDFGDGNTITNGAASVTHVYNTIGTYDVTLNVEMYCGETTITKQICIEEPPVPVFSLNTYEGCFPLSSSATNTTSTTNMCSSLAYLWEVNYTAANCGTLENWSFIGGTDTTSVNPQFQFNGAGIYNITLTVTNDCGAVTSIEQSVSVKSPPTANITDIPNYCGATSISPNATIEICTDNPAEVSYLWSFPGGMPSTSGLAVPGVINYVTPGDYTVTLEVTNNCGNSIVTENFSIFGQPVIDAQPLSSQTLCQNSISTDLEVTASVGTGSLSYQWYVNTINSTSGGNEIFGATNSTYTPPTDTIGTFYYYAVISQTLDTTCNITSEISEIEVLSAPTITLQPIDSSVCENGTPNTLEVVYENGTGTATYQWFENSVDNNTSGTEISGETSSTYTPPTDTIGTIYYYCEISFSSGGCTEIYSETAMVEVTAGVFITVQPESSQDVCVGGVIDTALSVSHSGGTGTITYQWFSNTTNNNFGGLQIGGATNSTYTPPNAPTEGTYYYYVEITISGAGCSGVASDVAVIIAILDPVVDTQPIVTQTLCQNATPNNLVVVASGGIGLFDYQWFVNTIDSNTGGAEISGEISDTYVPSTNTVGMLYYYVEISQGSSNLDCFVVSNTSEVEITQAPSFITQPMSSDICINEVANNLEVSYENGTGIPIYQWYSNTTDMNSGGTPITGANSAIYTPPTNNVGGLFYYCEITFSVGGCLLIVSNTAEVNISQTPVIVDFFDEVCSGLLFEFDPSTIGGNIVPSGTTYTWNLSNISPVGSISGATDSTSPQVNFSQTLTNLTTSVAVATYAVTPTSGICVGATFDVSITVNPGISVSVIINDSKCYQDDNGSIDAIISGGTPISPGNPYIINWTGPGGFSSNNASISNLEPGTYSLSIEDNSSCTFNMDYEVSEPNELILTTDAVNDISCFGFNDGEILISISGGTLPYTYLWKTSNGSGLIPSDEDQSNLSEGTYDVEITDANNCVITGQYQIIEPPELLISETHNSLLCFGDSNGTITVNIDQSSIPDYTYTISGIDYLGNPFNTTQTQPGTSFTANNLLAGIYDILVTDINGCEKVINAIEILQPIDIVVDVTKVNIVCYGDSNGSITLNVSGGVPSYTYLWSDLGSGPVRTNLSAGIYTVTVTDQNDCFKIIDIEILGPEFHIEPEVRNISCFGEDDGYINLNIFGGVSPITASWDDDATAGVERNNLPPGTYTVLVTDSDSPSCPINQSFIITEPSPISSSGLIVDALDCDIVESGSINLQVTGGILPFTFLWSNGLTTQDLTNIPPGDYSVIITDTNGCEEVNSFTVNRFPALDVLVDTITDFNCETRVVNQIFEAKPTGGVPPYQIRWSSGVVSGANNEFMTTDQEGLVLITIFDGIGCEKSISYDIVIPVLGDADFSLTSEANNTFGFYSIEDPIQFTNTAIGDFTNISWDFGDGNFSSELDPVHTYVNEGTYIVLQTVTYPFGCVYTKQITLIVEKGYSLIMPNAFTPNGDTMNAYFAPESVALNDITFNVYDTWGSLIYSEKGENIKGWNGKINDAEAENGNYYFTLSAKTFYGKTITKKGAFVSIK